MARFRIVGINIDSFTSYVVFLVWGAICRVLQRRTWPDELNGTGQTGFRVSVKLLFWLSTVDCRMQDDLRLRVRMTTVPSKFNSSEDWYDGQESVDLSCG